MTTFIMRENKEFYLKILSDFSTTLCLCDTYAQYLPRE